MKYAIPAPGSWSYEYLPYTSNETGDDIPNYRILPIDEAEHYIAETNEHLDGDLQEGHARLITASPDLYGALEYFFNIMHDYESSRRKGYVRLALEKARNALTAAKGGAI
jgi:hypothetical protein